MKAKERTAKNRPPAHPKRRATDLVTSPKVPKSVTVAVLEAPGRIQVQSRVLRTLQRLEVLVRVRRAGICGTDLSLYSGEYPVPLPLVPGHEWVGIIEATGPGVDARLVGQRVVGEINLTCVSREIKPLCPPCRRGLSNHCQTRDVMGIIRADGAWASHVIVPINNLHPVPPTVSDAHAVLVEPLAAAIQTFELCPIYPGFGVAVLGAGRLGSLILQVAALRGARTVAVSRSAAKRRRAKRLGAREVFAPGANLAEDLLLGSSRFLDSSDVRVGSNFKV
jgi:threonine dehydrogenase-like Zn-dependent dehydrogenase